jgi:hypothetical protein
MSDRLETPWERWSRDSRQLLFLTPEELEQAFVLFLRRSPSNDGLVPIDSVDYELPRSLRPRGRKKEPVQIMHQLLTDTYHVVADGRLVQLHPVDLEANARTPRGRARDERTEADPPPARSAADMAFERDLGPVTGLDGGFVEPPHQESDS